MVKDLRTMAGALRRVDATRWEACCWLDNRPYLTETLNSRELAEQHLARHGDALDAVGWTEG
jgi:hypothetical protein